MNISNPLHHSEAITYVVLSILEFLTIIVVNGIIIAVFTKTRQLRKRKSYWLCANLVVADLLVGAIAGPCLLYEIGGGSGLFEFSYSGHKYSAIHSIVQYMVSTSFINLVIISLERMYATLKPIKHRMLKAKNYHVMIGLSWALSLIVPANFIALRCNQIQKRSFLLIFLFTQCFFVLIIAISYVSICIKLKFFMLPEHHVTTAKERKLTMSLLLATAASMITIAPAVICVFAFHFQGKKLSLNRSKHLDNAVDLLLLANSLLNPIIYAFRISEVRRAALRLLCRRTTEKQEPAIKMRNRAEVINL